VHPCSTTGFRPHRQFTWLMSVEARSSIDNCLAVEYELRSECNVIWSLELAFWKCHSNERQTRRESGRGSPRRPAVLVATPLSCPAVILFLRLLRYVDFSFILVICLSPGHFAEPLFELLIVIVANYSDYTRNCHKLFQLYTWCSFGTRIVTISICRSVKRLKSYVICGKI